VPTSLKSFDGTSKLIVESISKDKETKQPPAKTPMPMYDDNVVNDEVLVVRNSEISLNFCEDCRIFREGEWEMKADDKVKVDGKELTEPDKMVDGVIQYSDDDQVDDQVLIEERSSIDGKPRVDERSRVDERPRVDERSSFKIPSVIEKPPVDERPRVGQRPRVDYKLTIPNCTQIVQYCGLDQSVEGVASCDVGGISPSSWSKHHFGMKSTRRSLQPLWSGLVGRRAVDAREVRQEVRFLRRRFLRNEGDLSHEVRQEVRFLCIRFPRDQTTIKVNERPLHQSVRERDQTTIKVNERPLHQLVREMFWWWLTLIKKKMWWWISIASIQATTIILCRFLSMTEYFVMRECENIQRLFTVQVTQYSVGLVRALCAHWVFILPF
jgi:hypothetical protein